MKCFPLLSVILTSLMSGAASSSANPSDVIIDHVSGYVVFSYESATGVHDDAHYAELVNDYILIETRNAQIECNNLFNELRRSAFNSLTKDIIDLFDSVKVENKFDDYALISSLIRKHAGSKSSKNFPNMREIPNIDVSLDTVRSLEEKRIAAGMQLNLTSTQQLVMNFFPTAYMSGTVKFYAGFSKIIDAKIGDLKNCYTKVEELSHKGVNNSLGISTFKVGTVKVLEKFESLKTSK